MVIKRSRDMRPRPHGLRGEPDRPLLSVVVPAYGVEEWIAFCLDSILDISMDGLEVVVIDDASPDRSGRIADDYAAVDPRVKVVHLVENRGLGAARNIGMDSAAGAYIAFVDSDDVISPSGFVNMVRRLQETSADIATGSATEFGSNRGMERYWTTADPLFTRGARRTTLAESPSLVYDHTAWNKVFRAEFLRKIGLRFPEQTTCEDIRPVLTALAQASSISVLAENVYWYRRRSGQISQDLETSARVREWSLESRIMFENVSQFSPQHVVDALGLKILTREAPRRLDAVLTFPEDESAAAARELLSLVMGSLSVQAVRQLGERLFYQIVAVLNQDVRILDIAEGRCSQEDSGVSPEWRFPPGVAREAMSSAGSHDDSVVARFVRGKLTRADEGRALPGLTVVVTTRNVSDWIDECIRSILDQEGVDLQIVAVDDWSTDGTWERLLSYRAEHGARVTVLRNPGRGGAQARNAGIALCKTEYVIFCDGDDIVAQNAYRTMLELAAETGSDMVVGPYLRFWPTKSWVAAGKYGLATHRNDVTLDSVPEILGNRTCWNRMVRRDLLVRGGIRFPSVPRANDIYPVTRMMLLAERIAVTDQITYIYRARPGMSSMTARLGAGESVSSYLHEEEKCALLIGAHSRASVSLGYWRAVLKGDLWAAVGPLVRDVAVRSESQPAVPSDSGVVAQLARLLSLAPREATDELGARRRMAYAFAAKGFLHEARDLWDLEERGARLVDPAARFDAMVRAMRVALEHCEGVFGWDPWAADTYRRDVRRLVIDEVVRPFSHNRVLRGPARTAAAKNLLRYAEERVGLAAHTAPWSPDRRVVCAIQLGGPWTIERNARRDADRDVIDAGASIAGQGKVLLELARDSEFEVAWIAAVRTGAHGKPAVAVGVPAAGPSDQTVRVEIDLSGLAPGTWRLLAYGHDSIGETCRVLRMALSGRGSTLWVRLEAGPDESLIRVLPKGVDRAVRAVQWRLARRRRLIEKTSGSGSRKAA